MLQLMALTHWGRVTHICVSELTIIGSDNGLSPGQNQAIIWNNAGLLLIEPLGTNFSEISIGIQTFSLKKMHLNMSSAKRRPFCLGLIVLIDTDIGPTSTILSVPCQYLGQRGLINSPTLVDITPCQSMLGSHWQGYRHDLAVIWYHFYISIHNNDFWLHEKYIDICNAGTVNTLRPRQFGERLQMTFLNVFCSMKIFEFWLEFHWSFFSWESNWQ